MEDTIKVALRIRPLSDSEILRGCQLCIDTIPNNPQVIIRNSDKAFTYNYVFGTETSQGTVYDSAVKDLVQQLFKGYNATILAYGQTGSGKTYTMDTCYNGQGEMGIIPRAICDIFQTISETPDTIFQVSTSFLELYKEQLYDLFACSKKPREQCVVDIREDSKGIVMPGLTEIVVASLEDTIQSLIQGSAGRATGATAMNAQSSRSHAIFTITLHMCKKNNSGGEMVSKFHLVDLAGSERPKKTGATGERFKEGVNINRGLFALGNVISALGDVQQKGFVSYRDSKLTRLLQDSLGGNSMTLMIACVSPADYNCEETLSTLRYADRARHIRNKPVVNLDPKAAEIMRLQKENTDLRLQLLAYEGGSSGQANRCPKIQAALEEEVSCLRSKIRKLTEALNNAYSESTNLMERALLAEKARDRMGVKLAELNAHCNQTISTIESQDLSADASALTMKDKVAGLKDLQLKITELQAEQKRGEQEIITHEIHSGGNPFSGNTEGVSSAPSSPLKMLQTPKSLAELEHHEEKHTLQQTELNQELQELTRNLAIKEQLAAQLKANCIPSVSIDYTDSMNQLETQINTLQQERDDLQQQLKSVQTNNASSKIAEQRRKRVQELEVKLTELKKKLLEQSKIIKLKEKSDEKIVNLNNEIRSMKTTRVRLLRQMKQENEQFRTWKLQREKELNKLKDQDRKRQNLMTRMETMHTKQQNVLKRKVEEASAINKRLKEALLLQKQSQEKRQQQTLGKSERIQSWVSQELEIAASTTAAERVREKLIEDRALISKQLAALKEALGTATPHDAAVLNDEIAQLKEDLELRSAQISDMNQKIVDSDQENKTRTRWDLIQSMIDAKCALKYLFAMATDIKRDAAMQEYSIQDLEDACKKAQAEVRIVEENLKLAEQKHKNDILAMEKENADKISLLLSQKQQARNNAECASPDDLKLRERIAFLEEELQQKATLSTELEKVKEECQLLKQELSSVSTKEKEDFKTPEQRKAKPKPKPKPLADYNVIESPLESENDFNDDDENDPDWQKTPLFRRLQKLKRKTTFTGAETSVVAVKRTSDGMTICTCKSGTCLRCACRKAGSCCSDSCKCDSTRCSNRSNENSMKLDSSDENTSFEAKKPRHDSSPADQGDTERDVCTRLFDKPKREKYFSVAKDIISE